MYLSILIALSIRQLHTGHIEMTGSSYCGHHELLNPPLRKNILESNVLLQLFKQPSHESLVHWPDCRIEEQLMTDQLVREGVWSDSIVVGDQRFVCNLLNQNKTRCPGLKVFEVGNESILREPRSD